MKLEYPVVTVSFYHVLIWVGWANMFVLCLKLVFVQQKLPTCKRNNTCGRIRWITIGRHFKWHSGKYQRLSNYIPLICMRMKRFSINLLVSILEMAENTNINCDKMSTENNKRMGPTKTFAMSSQCTKKAAVIQTLPVDWTPLNMQKYTMTQVTMRRPKSSQRIPPASLTPFVLSRSLWLGGKNGKRSLKKSCCEIYILYYISTKTPHETHRVILVRAPSSTECKTH